MPVREKLKIYVGYDSREDIAWQVCRFSLLRHASGELEIHALKQSELRARGLYTRGPDRASTEFSLTRFLTPHLAAHDGWTLFVDCDFLFTTDVLRVLDHADRGNAIHVVKHDYTPARAVKMDGRAQSAYTRKNWSSFMLFNNAHRRVKALTPAVVNSESPSFLHRLSWLGDDRLIGELPRGWNFLEGEYPKPERAPQAIHFTNGGPWFPNKQDVDYAELWYAERDRYLQSQTVS